MNPDDLAVNPIQRVATVGSAQVEAYAGLEQYAEASEALQAAGDRFPAFVRSDEYKSMRRQLDKLLRR